MDQNQSNSSEPIKQSPLRRLFQRRKDLSDPEVTTIPTGTHEDVWGVPICLGGLLASVAIFHETISAAQVKTLYTVGKVKGHCETTFCPYRSTYIWYDIWYNPYWHHGHFHDYTQVFLYCLTVVHGIKWYFSGPNHPVFFSEDDYPDFADLPSKALVYYNAKVNIKKSG